MAKGTGIPVPFPFLGAGAMKSSRLLVVVSVLGVAVGCGGGKGSVSGKVQLEGKPLNSGTITFFGKDGVPYASPIDGSGNYTVTDVPAGTAKIVIISPDPRETNKDR